MCFRFLDLSTGNGVDTEDQKPEWPDNVTGTTVVYCHVGCPTIQSALYRVSVIGLLVTTTSKSDQFLAWINKWIMPSASVFFVVGAFLGVILYMIRSEIKGVADDVATLKADSLNATDRIQKTNERIDTVLTKALDRAFPPANADKAAIRGSLDDINGVLQFARNLDVQLNPHLLATYGQQLLEISSDQSVSGKAWNVLGNLLNYRSSLNIKYSPAAHESFGPSSEPQLISHASVHFRGPGAVNITFPNRLVPANEAFIYQPITDNAVVASQGHPFVKITTTGMAVVLLDGIRLKNVIFDGVTIEYKGGPLAMQNAYFVNCRFEVVPSGEKSKQPLTLFTKAVLENVPTSVLVTQPAA